MTSEKVKQIIEQSSFKAGLKARLNSIVADLDMHTLEGLGLEVSRKDSKFIAEHLVATWESFAAVIKGLKKGDSSALAEFFKLFSNIDPLTNEDDRVYFLYLVLDVRTLVTNNRINFSNKQFEAILDYEVSLFWYLPKEEVIFYLQNNLVYLQSKVNLLAHIKAIVWDNDWDFIPDFSKIFSDSIFQSKEKFAGKSIGDWVKKYFEFSSPSSFRADVMQVAEFLIKDPEIKKLTDEEKKTLSEILKVYVWLLKPDINEDEIFDYKEEIRTNQGEQLQQYILSSEQNLGAVPKAPPLMVPVPKSATNFKPIEEIRVMPKEVVQLPFQNKVPQVQNAAVGGKPFASISQSRVNIQDILKSRYEQEEGQHAGLVIGGGAQAQPQKNNLPSSAASAADNKIAFSVGKQEKEQKQSEIDKKLAELEKRTGIK